MTSINGKDEINKEEEKSTASRPICYYFNRPQGCRNMNDDCPFAHIKDVKAGVAQTCKTRKCRNKTRPGYLLCPSCHFKKNQDKNHDDCDSNCSSEYEHEISPLKIPTPAVTKVAKVMSQVANVVKSTTPVKSAKSAITPVVQSAITTVIAEPANSWADIVDDEVSEKKSSIKSREISCCTKSNGITTIVFTLKYCTACLEIAEKTGQFLNIGKCKMSNCNSFTPVSHCSKCL